MNWYRQRSEICWLALFAMALQLVLSFGHIHGPQHIDGKIQLAANSLHEQGSHSRHHQDNKQQEENTCSICWTLKVAGSLVLPDAGVMPRHFDRLFFHQILKKTAIVSNAQIHPYQVRAPPAASFA